MGELNKREWEQLESFIIERGNLEVQRVSIIAGALLKDNNPVCAYEDKFYKTKERIQIPVVYWKIVFYEVDGELRKIAFFMSQKNRLDKLPIMETKADAKLAPDPFDKLGDPLKTYIVKSSLIESETDLAFTPAKELYDKDEPLEVVIKDNDVEPDFLKVQFENISQFI